MHKTKDKKARRFTLLDGIILFVVLIILGAVGFVIYRFSPVGNGETGKQNKIDIEYTVEIKALEDKYVSNIAVGDAVIDSVTKKAIGTVSAIESMPYTEYVINYEKDAIEEKEYPGQSTLLVTISAEAALGETGYEIGDGYRVAIGVLHYLQMSRFVGSGYCISLNLQN